MEQVEGPMCPEHARLIEYFCQDDEVPICSRCYIMGDHKDHAIVSFEEKNKSIVASLENQLESATIVVNKLSKLNRSSLEKRYQIEKRTLVESIRQTFRHLHNVLKRREKDILDEVSNIFDKRMLSAAEQIENAKNEREKLERALHETGQLLENQALVVDGDSLLKIINEASNVPCILPKLSSPTCELKWDNTHMEDIVDAIQSFGTVAGDKEELIQLKTVDESPDDIEDVDRIFRSTFSSQISCDTHSISSVDTGEDIIIESDTASVTSTTPTISSVSSMLIRSSTDKDLVLPQVKGPLKQVCVTHIITPNDFYVQLLLNKKKLETLSHNLNAWCRRKASTKQIPLSKSVKKGMHVLACYSADNQWYRALVIDVVAPQADGDNEMKVHVIYFDFGNEEKVPLKSLRTMQPRFDNYAPFCVRCSLFDISPFDNTSAWDQNSIQEFFKITQPQILLLNVIAMNGPIYEVDLICMPLEEALNDSFSSVRDMLIFMECGRFASPSRPNIPGQQGPRMKTVNYFKPTSLRNGDTLEMVVSEACSPSDFYMLPDGEEYLYYLNMMKEMQEMYSNDAMGLYTMHCPRKDCVCAVKGPDDRWYRGKILSEPRHRKVSVYLTDTGSTLVVAFDRTKKLLSDFIKLPSQAVHCSLADVSPTDTVGLNDWSQDAKVWCQTDMKGHQGLVRIVRWGDVTDVVLWIGTSRRSVNSLLVEAGLAVSTGLSSLPAAQNTANLPNKSTYQNDTSKKSQQKSSCSKSVSNLPNSSQSSPSSERSLSASHKSPHTSPRKGSPQKKSTSVAVKQKTSSEKKKKTKTSETNKPETDSDFSTAAETARKKRIQENIHKAVGGSEEAGNGGSKESMYIEIVVSYFKSPSDFFIRVKDNEGVLEELMEELNQKYEDSVVDAQQLWKTEDFCVVRNPTDKLWYRGKINSIVSPPKYEVELLDYGHTCCVSGDDLRPLTRDLATHLHRAAVRCHLASLIPTGSSDRNKWSQTATEFVASIVSTKKLYIKTEGDVTDNGLPIDIIYEEEIPETAFDPVTYIYHSLRQSIMDKGLAMFDKTQKLTTPSPSSDKGENPLKQEIMAKGVVSTKDEEEVERRLEPNVEKAPDLVKVPKIVEVPPYDIPKLNEEIEVIATFVDFSGVIYAQRVDWDSQIAHLSEELQRVFEDSPPQHVAWSPGHVCVAFFQDDGLWYRGLVEEVDRDKAKIFYMDFGNSAWVSFDNLREIHTQFAEFHIQVYHCVLEDLVPNTQDGQWPLVLLDTMHEFVVNYQCTMTYTGMQDDGRLKIKLLKPDGMDLATHLLEKGYVVSTMDLKDQFANSQAVGAVLSSCELCSVPYIGGPGCVFKAIATEVELPNIVYVQRIRVEEHDSHDFVRDSEIAIINNEIVDFEKMMVDINSMPSSDFITLPDVGVLCLGKFHFDNSWYRAVCVDKYPSLDSCLITFLDYGTSEIVSRERLRILPTEFWKLPRQGIRCYLNLLPPGGPNAIWQKNSMDAMVFALAQKELTVKIVQLNPLTVELLVEIEGGMSLAYEALIQNGLAMLPMQVDMDVLMDRDGRKRSTDDVEVEDADDVDNVRSADIVDGNPDGVERVESVNQNCMIGNGDGLIKDRDAMVVGQNEPSVMVNGVGDEGMRKQGQGNRDEEEDDDWTTDSDGVESEDE